MLALTVLQPWASALVLGHKPVENRTRACPAALPPGAWLAIHAGRLDARVLSPHRNQALRELWPDAPASWLSLPKGTFVGAIRIEGYGRHLGRAPLFGEHHCRLLADSATCDLRPDCTPWASDPDDPHHVCWVRDQFIALPVPRLSWTQKGRQGVWPCPAAIEAEIVQAVAAKYGAFPVRIPTSSRRAS